MRKFVFPLLVLSILLAPSAGFARRVMDDEFGIKKPAATQVKGGEVDPVLGRGWRELSPAPKTGGSHIVYDLSKSPGVAESGTVLFRLVRNPLADHDYETLFSFVDNNFHSLVNFQLHYGGITQKQFPEIFATLGGPGLSLNSVLFNKPIAVGQEFTLICAWDKSGVRFYLDGIELTGGGMTGPFEYAGKPIPNNNVLRVYEGFTRESIPDSRYLVLGIEYNHGEPQKDTVFISTLLRFSAFDAALLPGQVLADKVAITSVTDDSFKIPGIGGKLVAGETVTATLVAQPGGNAFFDMGRVKGITMQPVPVDNGAPGRAPVLPGTYSGSYTIKPGDDFADGQIAGQFTSSDNVVSDAVLSASRWTIETKPVVTFSIASRDLPADLGTKSRIKLTAKDSNGNPLSGRNIKLTLSTTDEYTGTVGAGDFGKQVGASIETRWKGATDAWGEVEFDYVAGFAAKTVLLQAKDLDSGGVSVDYITAYKEASIDIALTAPRSLAAARRGMQYMIKVEASRTQLTADGKSRSVIRATVTDPNGKTVPGDAVTFALSSPNGTLRTIVGVTDTAGVATAEYIAGKKIGIVVISATDTVRNISGNVSILLLSDAPAKIILRARPESLPADGNSKADIQVKVTDINDNPNKDTRVEFKVSHGAGKLDYPDRITDTFGDALNRFQAGTTPGIATILATVRSKVPTEFELLKAKNVIFVPYNESDDSVRIEKWLKKKGDTVLRGEPIVSFTVGRSSEIRTIDAPYDLTMGETVVEYWDNAEVGQTLATVIPTVK